MGPLIDSSAVIAGERGRVDWPKFLGELGGDVPAISAIAVAELLHGVERSNARHSRESTSGKARKVKVTRALIKTVFLS